MASLYTMIFCILCILVENCYGFGRGQYGFTLGSNTKSFGSAIKDGHSVAGVEQTLFECKPGMQGIITEQWSGGGTIYNESAVISIYIDGELTPSIQYNYLLGHGVGFSAANETTVVTNNGYVTNT